jgi:hypothetical protein
MRHWLIECGCNQTVGGKFCVPTIPTSVLLITRSRTGTAARVGINGVWRITERLKLTGDAAWVPYARLSAKDFHWARIGTGLPEGIVFSHWLGEHDNDGTSGQIHRLFSGIHGSARQVGPRPGGAARSRLELSQRRQLDDVVAEFTEVEKAASMLTARSSPRRSRPAKSRRRSSSSPSSTG